MPPLKKRVAFDPEAFLVKIVSGRRSVTYRAGSTIYAQGDVDLAVYYLQKGKVKKTVTSKTGKEAVLAILAPGDFFGESSLNAQVRRVTTTTAMTDCIAMRLERAAMLRALHDNPEFSDLFMLHLLHRNNRAQEDLVDQLFNSSEKRLARTLLLLANFGKDNKPEPVIAKISQETLAEMVGTTRSRVSFFMNKFRRLGFIDYVGGGKEGLHVNTSLLNIVLMDGVPPPTHEK
jgi:CRP/FNR family transcriptional regulator, cyclic AMP receptor protein